MNLSAVTATLSLLAITLLSLTFRAWKVTHERRAAVRLKAQPGHTLSRLH
jgi:hypothetical protein